VFNNVKITLHYSVYMRASGEKVRVSDEAERVQSVSHSHTRSLSGPYTLVCLREGKRGTCLRPSFATVMCKVPCSQRGPTTTVMYKWSTFLSKGPLTSLICSASYFNFGDRSFRWGAKWRRDWILGPLWQRDPPIGGYGVRLIRLWLQSALTSGVSRV